MGKTRLDLGLLLALLVTINDAAQGTSAPSSLSKHVPRGLEDSLSPLSAEQQLYYSKLLKRADSQPMSESAFDEFCTKARLLCSSTLLQQSKWGARAGGPKTASSFSDVSLKCYHEWDLPPRTEDPVASVTKAEEGSRDQTEVSSGRGDSEEEFTAAKPEGAKQYFREMELALGAKLVLPSFIYEPASRDKSNAVLKPSFLPVSMALVLPPFDMQHLTDLLKLFRIPSNSELAKKMEVTLKACTDSDQAGLGTSKKKKDDDDESIVSSCVTSIEALIKFVMSMLKAPEKDIQALTNSEVVGSKGDTVTILQTTELAAGHDAVDCHDLVFPFKVMGCHRIKQSKAMVVKVQAEKNGKDMDLLVACHKNTTLFNPHHEALAQLQSSPGHTEICHFLPNGDIMWIPL